MQAANNARLFLDSSGELRQDLIEFANEHPQEFLSYLKGAWERNSALLLRHPSLLEKLNQLSVPCADGKKHALSSAWLPERELMFLCGRYLLPEEPFPFLVLKKPLTRQECEDSWAFLPTHFQVKCKEDLDFYLQILISIRQYSEETAEIEIPRRVLELYLQIQSLCIASDDGPRITERVRSQFETHELILTSKSAWVSPKSCVLYNVPDLFRKQCLFPLSPGWKATEAETTKIGDFYKNVLGIQTKVSCMDILHRLDDIRAKDNVHLAHLLQNVVQCFQYITKELPPLSDSELVQLRSSFNERAYIACVTWQGVKWYKPSECAWSYGVEIPGLCDLTSTYSTTKVCFTEFLQVKEFPVGNIYQKLLDVQPDSTPVENVKRLLFSLSSFLPEYGNLLDKKSFLKKAFVPIRNGKGEVYLSPVKADFFITDRRSYQQHFSDKLDLLDFSPFEVWVLGPLMTWTDLESRYLSLNIQETSYLETAPTKVLTSKFTSQFALGLIRLGRHFHSPRLKQISQRQSLLQKVERAVFQSTEGIRQRLSIAQKGVNITVEQLECQLHIEETKDSLIVNVLSGKEAEDMYLASQLPHGLVVWLMTDPTTGITPRVPERAESLMKTIVNVRPGLVERILDEAGIVRLEEPDLCFDISAKPANALNLEQIGHKAALTKDPLVENITSAPPKVVLNRERISVADMSFWDQEIACRLKILGIADGDATGVYRLSGGRTYESFDSTIVRITTQNGIQGFGESTPFGATFIASHALGVRAGIAEMAPHLIGLDPRCTDRLNDAMDAALVGHLPTKAAIDILLGGSTGISPPLMCSLPVTDPEDTQRIVAEARAASYLGFSVKIEENPASDAAHIVAALSGKKENEDFLIDVNGGMTVEAALRMLRLLPPGMDFVLVARCATYGETKSLKRRINVPIISDELLSDEQSAIHIVSEDAAEGINLRVSKLGGLEHVASVTSRSLQDTLSIHKIPAARTLLSPPLFISPRLSPRDMCVPFWIVG
ncbi:Cis-3-hydroxy-L-proline dehydratase [Paramyrothecium foliicola]|nr:Cis-3-hydroxy-L-proline dehydratase [Paramyrothecium foliicola]